MKSPVLCAYDLNGPTAGNALASKDVAAALKDDAAAWVHLDGTNPDVRAWLEANLDYLDPHILSALLADETRPRATQIGQGALIILRGVNHNEGADPEDMVSLRIWADSRQIVTISRRHLRSVEEAESAFAAGRSAPARVSSLLNLFIDRLNYRIDQYLSALDESVDAIEEALITENISDLRGRIVQLRQKAIVFRRYCAPQRDALLQLYLSDVTFLNELDRRHVFEANDRMIRLIEDLDASRERLSLLREEVSAQIADRMNANMYRISILSAVFLPLTFLTGLFGINVAGLPGAEISWAFWGFCGALAVMVALQVALLRMARWI